MGLLSILFGSGDPTFGLLFFIPGNGGEVMGLLSFPGDVIELGSLIFIQMKGEEN